MKIRELIRNLRSGFNQDKDAVVFDVEKGKLKLIEIAWVSDNGGHAQINTSDAAQHMMRDDKPAKPAETVGTVSFYTEYQNRMPYRFHITLYGADNVVLAQALFDREDMRKGITAKLLRAADHWRDT